MLHYGTLRYFTVHCDTQHTTRPRPRTWMINRVHMTKHVYFCYNVCVYVSKKYDAPQYCPVKPVKIKLGRVVNYRICIYIYIRIYIYIQLYIMYIYIHHDLPILVFEQREPSMKIQPTSGNRTSSRPTFPNAEPPCVCV